MGETAAQPGVAATRQAIPRAASLDAKPERIDAIWPMRREERVAPSLSTSGEMLQWAAQRPHKVPLVDGEFFFITAVSADCE